MDFLLSDVPDLSIVDDLNDKDYNLVDRYVGFWLVQQCYKNGAPADLGNANNMEDITLPFSVIADEYNPGESDAYDKPLSDEANRHDVKKAKEFAKQWKDLEHAKTKNELILVQLLVCGSNAYTYMHKAVHGPLMDDARMLQI